MERNLTCIICPRGCALKVQMSDGKCTVTGQTCPKGEKYGIAECTAPVRTVTSVVCVSNRENTMVSVKTSRPIPKERMFEVMAQIRGQSIPAPLKIGDVILTGVYGADIVATKDVY